MRNAAARALLFLGFWLISAVLTACRGASPQSRLRVAVSLFPEYDLTRRVAGPDADVVLIVPPGRDPHAYAPTDKDRDEVAHAGLAIMNGLGLDPWMEKARDAAGPKARLLKLGDRVPTLMPPDDEQAPSATLDPHVWLDPSRARLMVKAIAEEMARADAPHALAYRARATEIDASLEALDKEIEKETTNFSSRELVTFHSSFGYFAERYHLKVIGVVETTPGTAPDAASLDALGKLATAHHVRALFREPALDPAQVFALAQATHLPVAVLDPLGGTADVDSYEKLLRFDVAAMRPMR